MPDADLADMEKQPKNRPEDVELEIKNMDKMRLQTADACSGRWFDKSGRLMVAVFADHIVQVSEFWLCSVSLHSQTAGQQSRLAKR
jgi:hypothetical protein